MAEAETKDDNLFWNSRPSVRDYTLACIGAQLVLLVVLMALDLGCWAILVVIIGLGGLAARWALAPPLVMGVVMLMIGARGRFAPTPLGGTQEPPFVFDLLLAMSLMIYSAAHWRLLTLVKHALPPDKRRQTTVPSNWVDGRWLLPKGKTTRSSDKPGAWELPGLFVGAFISVVLGYLLWVRLAVEPVPGELQLPWQVWRVIVTTWVVFVLLMLAYLLMAYLQRVLAGPEESLLYLQDQLWSQTRGEQRSIWRWLTWGRLRNQARSEK